jgi:hypothetical protein
LELLSNFSQHFDFSTRAQAGRDGAHVEEAEPLAIVDGETDLLKSILKTIMSCMSGGKVVSGKGLSRQNSFAMTGDAMETEPALGV